MDCQRIPTLGTSLLRATLVAALFSSLGGSAGCATLDRAEILDSAERVPRAPGTLRVLSLNLAHGRGTSFNQILLPHENFQINLEAVASFLRVADADVVALQELDGPSSWSGGIDHLERLAALAGYPYRYHGLHVDNSTLGVRYGTGFLSRLPIERTRSHAFDLNAFDTKGYALVRLRTAEGALDFVSVHLDFKFDSERRAQLEILDRHLRARPQPAPNLVVAGDFNCALDDSDGNLAWFADRQGLRAHPDARGTYPSDGPKRRIDYVLASGGLEFSNHVVSSVRVSDHLPVFADLRWRGRARPPNQSGVRPAVE